MVARGEFLEYARVFGKHSYGTPKKWLEESRSKGIDLVLEIDVQGAAQVKQKLPESVAIFILPPLAPGAGAEAAQPRDGRRTTKLRGVWRKAKGEIELAEKFYDFCVVNDDVERAGREAQAIVMALRCSSAPGGEVVKKVLGSFGG